MWKVLWINVIHFPDLGEVGDVNIHLGNQRQRRPGGIENRRDVVQGLSDLLGKRIRNRTVRPGSELPGQINHVSQAYRLRIGVVLRWWSGNYDGPRRHSLQNTVADGAAARITWWVTVARGREMRHKFIE